MDQNNEPEFIFKFSIENDEFDNFDNPYGKFILHRYSNMKDINDTQFDEGEYNEDYDHEIELVESDAISGNWDNRSVKYYKPKFTDQDFLYGWYNT